MESRLCPERKGKRSKYLLDNIQISYTPQTQYTYELYMTTRAIVTHMCAHDSHEPYTRIHSIWFPDTAVGCWGSILLRPLRECVEHASDYLIQGQSSWAANPLTPSCHWLRLLVRVVRSWCCSLPHQPRLPRAGQPNTRRLWWDTNGICSSE